MSATTLAPGPALDSPRAFRLRRQLVPAGAELEEQSPCALKFSGPVAALLIEIGPDDTGYLVVPLESVEAHPEVFEEIV